MVRSVSVSESASMVERSNATDRPRAVGPRRGSRLSLIAPAINVSSGTWLHTSRTANSSNSHYVASKAAVMALTRSVSRELGQFNIKVNTLAPGATEVGLGEDEDPSSDPERALGRRGRAEDLTGAVVFLFSEDSDFVTGQMLLVNGGMEVY